jgi:L,D-transpeptidase ErfK/SrfK
MTFAGLSRLVAARARSMSFLVAGALISACAPLAGSTAQTPQPYPSIIGEIQYHTTGEEDTLVDLALAYNVGFTSLVAANQGVDPWVPGEGLKLTLPRAHILPAAERKGIVINLPEQRLYFFREDKRIVETMPIGIGAEGFKTPLGKTEIKRKRTKPTWYVPKSIRQAEPDLPEAVPPGPDNPLGEYAFYLGWQAYLIHGTNKPYGIGRRSSHGCIRLYPEDIERLYKLAPIGTQVTVVDQPYKIAWFGGELFLEVHPTQSQADELEEEGRFTPVNHPELGAKLVEAAATEADRVDWAVVRKAVAQRRGVPIAVLKPKATADRHR